MRRIYGILSLLFVSILFLRCQPEVSFYGTSDNGSELAVPDPINSTIQGNVFDESGQPASGVTIQVGSKTATTDAKGYFRIKDASLDKKASLVTAAKAGYFKA